MPRCPACSSEVHDGKRFCADCGAEIAPEVAATQTSLNDAAGASSPGGSVSSPQNERFAPGTSFAERYRIVGLLGRGGMGEVYRADDLKLGQPVAIKLLPEHLQHDPDRLQRFLNEVRVALKVSHPNVCRVHDIGEIDGTHYLSMEYIDGEDLSTLLRRIGRLPEDKAVQIARELCAGLAAAHDEGILHRDLKPANIMLDGRGRVRITDFGLAGLVEGFSGAEVRAGTPAYMSPEQLSGTEVTVRSDIYALGLLLYELFTGKPAFGGRTPGEVARLQQETTPTSPSSHISGLDPAVEAVILRCLEKDPRQRPVSATAVAAALPGGDPLAAALAAGETPSPEMIAEVAVSGGLNPRVAWAFLLTTLVAIVAAGFFHSRLHLVHAAPLEQSGELLAAKARDLIANLGYETAGADENYGFGVRYDYLRHVESNDDSAGRWDVLATGQPSTWRFWYRSSPRPLARVSQANVIEHYEDPPFTVSGMAGVHLDAEGRLLWLDGVADERVQTAEPAFEPEWSLLFDGAGLDIEQFRPTEPEWSPNGFADRRQAWLGHYPLAPDVPIRIEAAAFRGRLVSFRIVEPWTESNRMVVVEAGTLQRFGGYVTGTIPFIIYGGAAFVAVRNLKLGRSDRKGAVRLALYLMTVRFLTWLVGTDDLFRDLAADSFQSNLAWSIHRFGSVWLFYVALEPYLRRIWPRTMVSWTRMLDGRLRDPLVGRDVLVGSLMVSLLSLVTAGTPLLAWKLGSPPNVRPLMELEFKSLIGLKSAVGAMLFQHAFMILYAGMFSLVLLLLLRLLLRRTWLAVVVWSPVYMLLQDPFQAGSLWTGLVLTGLFTAWYLVNFFRVGLLSLMVSLGLIGFIMVTTPTFDPSQFYADSFFLSHAIFAATAIYGFYVSLAGRPMFQDAIDHDARYNS